MDLLGVLSHVDSFCKVLTLRELLADLQQAASLEKEEQEIQDFCSTTMILIEKDITMISKEKKTVCYQEFLLQLGSLLGVAKVHINDFVSEKYDQFPTNHIQRKDISSRPPLTRQRSEGIPLLPQVSRQRKHGVAARQARRRGSVLPAAQLDHHHQTQQPVLADFRQVAGELLRGDEERPKERAGSTQRALLKDEPTETQAAARTEDKRVLQRVRQQKPPALLSPLEQKTHTLLQEQTQHARQEGGQDKRELFLHRRRETRVSRRPRPRTARVHLHGKRHRRRLHQDLRRDRC